MELAGKDICVLGGGIGGLASALALARHGAKVTVLEQASEIREVGAGLQISPNGNVVLNALGLQDAMAKASVLGRAVSLRNGARDSEVFALNLTGLANDAQYRFVHRADLINMLADAARHAGVNIKLQQKVDRVDIIDGRARVRTTAGAVSEPEVLIGADGLHSHVHTALNGVSKPFFTNQVAWRAVVPNNGLMDAKARVFMGAGRHLVCYPLRGGDLLNIVAVEERENWAAEGWTHRDDPENLRAAFADFAPVVQDVLGRVEQVHLWGLFRHKVAENWCQGQVGILGDAAHPTLPFMAQGAVMALEDAWVLGEALEQSQTIEAGLADYQNRRITRVKAVVDAASKNARNYHLKAGPMRAAAHTFLKLGSTFAPGMALKKFGWLYDYDVTRGGVG